jgi:RNA polymerase sigma-B factor
MARRQDESRRSFDDRDRETDHLFQQLHSCTGDDDARSRVVESIVGLYLPLCTSMAQRYDGRGVEHDDLVQVARLALLKAINRFVPGRGRSFAAYAVPTMSGELKRHFRDRGWMVRPPRRIQELRKDVTERRAAVEQELGQSVTDREIAQALDLAVQDVRELGRSMSCFRPLSLDTPVGEAQPEPTATLAYEDADFELVENRVCLAKGLAQLDHRSRTLLALRYGDELTQREIGDALGMTQMQVSRTLARVLCHLRATLDAGEYDESA